MTKLRRTVVASILAVGALTLGGVGISNALAASSHPGTTQQQSSSSGSGSNSGSATHHCPNEGSGSSGNSGSSSTTSTAITL